MPTSKQIYQALMEQNPTKMWTTEIWAVHPEITGNRFLHNPRYVQSVKWQGPHVPGTSLEDAQRYCNEHGLGYCRVVGEWIAEGYIDTVLDNNN